MSNLSLIADVSIGINSPVTDSTSFDNLLILGPLPKVPLKDVEVPDVGVFSGIDEVTDCGFVATGKDADPVGVAARIAFSQNPPPSKIYIAVQKVPETISTSVNRTFDIDGWFMLCPAGIDESVYKEIAEIVEAKEKMFSFTLLSEESPVSTVYLRSFGIFGKESYKQAVEDVPEENKYMNVAYCAKFLNYEAGSETWVHKQLFGVHPAKLSSTERAALDKQNISYLITVASDSLVFGGKVVGDEWIDVIRFRDWLKNDMQLRLVNLHKRLPKVPFTDPGIALVKNQMIASLKAGQKVGGIAPDEYGEDDELIPGYIISVPKSASITASQKKKRILTNCKFDVRIAGAIHLTNLKGNMVYEFA